MSSGVTPGGVMNDFAQALRSLAVAIAGDPYPAHYDGGRLRRRRHDGRLPRLARGVMLPPHWKAARKRKRVGAMENIERFGLEVSTVMAGARRKQVEAFQPFVAVLFDAFRGWAEGEDE